MFKEIQAGVAVLGASAAIGAGAVAIEKSIEATKLNAQEEVYREVGNDGRASELGDRADDVAGERTDALFSAIGLMGMALLNGSLYLRRREEGNAQPDSVAAQTTAQGQ